MSKLENKEYICFDNKMQKLLSEVTFIINCITVIMMLVTLLCIDVLYKKSYLLEVQKIQIESHVNFVDMGEKIEMYTIYNGKNIRVYNDKYILTDKDGHTLDLLQYALIYSKTVLLYDGNKYYEYKDSIPSSYSKELPDDLIPVKNVEELKNLLDEDKAAITPLLIICCILFCLSAVGLVLEKIMYRHIKVMSENTEDNEGV